MLTRRRLICSGLLSLTVRPSSAAPTAFEVDLTESEWRARLTPAQFAILRERRTEHAWSNHLGNEESTLLLEDRDGTYHCAGCQLGVYRSETKYDSGTGWPSFWEAIDGAVLEYDDNGFFIRRTGVMCQRCGGHMGHVFDDGPPPTGRRHCINGLAMTFAPD